MLSVWFVRVTKLPGRLVLLRHPSLIARWRWICKDFRKLVHQDPCPISMGQISKLDLSRTRTCIKPSGTFWWSVMRQPTQTAFGLKDDNQSQHRALVFDPCCSIPNSCLHRVVKVQYAWVDRYCQLSLNDSSSYLVDPLFRHVKPKLGPDFVEDVEETGLFWSTVSIGIQFYIICLHAGTYIEETIHHWCTYTETPNCDCKKVFQQTIIIFLIDIVPLISEPQPQTQKYY